MLSYAAFQRIETPLQKKPFFFFYCSLTICIETYYVGNTFFKGEFKYILRIELCPTNHVGHSTVIYRALYMAGIVLRLQKWVRQSSLGFMGRLRGP